MKLIYTTLYFLFLSLSLINAKQGPRLEARIVNGIATTANDYPFIAYLELAFGDNYYFCTGSILQKEDQVVILTAAHCFFDALENKISSASDITVYLYRTEGADDLLLSTEVIKLTASDFVVHEDYDLDEYSNDIGLVFVNEDLSDNDKISTVSLPDDDGCEHHEALQGKLFYLYLSILNVL